MLKDMLKFYFYHYYLFLHILANTKFNYVTSTYYHSWYLMFEFTFNVTYFHRVIDIESRYWYLLYQTLNILFSVVYRFVVKVRAFTLMSPYPSNDCSKCISKRSGRHCRLKPRVNFMDTYFCVLPMFFVLHYKLLAYTSM
jgi:hypothetical protein